MTRGRKPTPTRLHEIHGTFREDRHGGAEPQPKEAVPVCPAHLDDEAKREWRRVVRELKALGLLTQLDRAALAGYCVAWSRWAHAEAQVAKHGPVLIETLVKGEDADGNAVSVSRFYPNPYLAVANAALRQLHSFGSEFGMSPSSRTRLKVEAAPAADPFAQWLENGGSAN